MQHLCFIGSILAVQVWRAISKDLLRPEHPFAVHKGLLHQVYSGWDVKTQVGAALVPDCCDVVQCDCSAPSAGTHSSLDTQSHGLRRHQPGNVHADLSGGVLAFVQWQQSSLSVPQVQPAARLGLNKRALVLLCRALSTGDSTGQVTPCRTGFCCSRRHAMTQRRSGTQHCSS